MAPLSMHAPAATLFSGTVKEWPSNHDVVQDMSSTTSAVEEAGLLYLRSRRGLSPWRLSQHLMVALLQTSSCEPSDNIIAYLLLRQWEQI